MTNIAIFVSGNGTNCENIIRHFNGNSSINVRLVISNRADAYALTRAKRLGTECIVLTKAEINDEQLMNKTLDKYGIDFIVLAGFMLMIPGFLTKRFHHRIINIHPSLLPKYGGKGMYGGHVHKAVHDAGETETGITIHYVTDVCDGGEIIAQFKTQLTAQDTVEDIEAKVHILEQAHFPEIIERTINNITGNTLKKQ